MASDSANEAYSWRDAPAFVALIGAVSIAFAIARQLGFFFQIDLTLLSFLSLDDILRTSLHIVPITIFMWMVGSILSDTRSGRPSVIQKFLFESADPSREMKLMILFTAAMVVFTPYWPFIIALYAILILGVVFAWLRKKQMLKSRFSVEALFFVYFIGIMFLLGAIEGKAVLLSDRRPYEVILPNGTTIEVNLLRVTSDALLVSTSPTEIWVLPRSEAKVIKRKNIPESAALISLPAVWHWIVRKIQSVSK